jgi:hypothetical protein
VTQSLAGRVVSFVAITWSVAGGLLLLQQGLPELLDAAIRRGLIPNSLVMPRSPSATVDCRPALQRAKTSTTDPRVVAQARFLVWRMGIQTGFAAGIADATVVSPSPTDAAPLLAQQPREIAGLLGVDPPTLPATRHAANVLSEFQAFVAEGASCVGPQLAEKYRPRESGLFKYGLVVGHAAVYRINAPQLDPLFVPEMRAYGAEAELPPELSRPFIVGETLNSLPGNGIGEKVQSALNLIEEFVKANP